MISPILSFAGRALRAMPLAMLVLAAGCDPRTGPEPEPPLPTSCSEPGGTEYRGVLPPGELVWRGADGPHRLVETVELDTLTIEAGALVCGAAGAEILINPGGVLTVVGTSDAPIRLTAEDPSWPWGGIRGSTWVTLSHVVLEHAITGVRGPGAPGARVVISHSLLRHFQASAVSTSPDGWITLVESTVDSACLAGVNCAAVVSGGARAVSIHFEESVIRNSGGRGLSVGEGVRDPPPLTLKGGAIEGSAGTGLFTAGRNFGIRIEKPIRITGGGSYPASVHLKLAAEHLATPEGQAMWMGNARDTVLINIWPSHVDSVTIRPGLVWSFALPSSSQIIDVLTLEAGAGLVMWGDVFVRQLVSEGTSEDPVEVRGATAMARFGISTGSQLPRPSRLTQTRFKDISLTVGTPGFVGRDLVLDSSRVRLAASNIRIERIAITSSAPLEISGEDVVIEGCEITGSAMAGIRVTSSGGVRISHCNIHGHGGLGLENLSDAPVDARNNWWGDPAGPHGPEGAGVSGNVLYEPWLTEPVPADRLPRTGDDR